MKLHPIRLLRFVLCCQIFTAIALAQVYEPFYFENAPRHYHTYTPNPIPVNEMGIIDMDGDGDMDMVRNQNMILEFLENHGGAFTLKNTINVFQVHGLVPFDVKTGDFDHDNLMDVLLLCAEKTYPYNTVLLVYGGDGKGGFTPLPLVNLPLLDSVKYLYIHDADGDGLDDVVAYNYQGKLVILGSKTGLQQLTISPTVWGLEMGDLNNDGCSDLVWVSQSGNLGQVQMILNNGFGYFTNPPQGLPVIDQPYGLELLDFDNDNNLDMVTTSTYAPIGQQYVEVASYKGDGKGGFGPVQKSFILDYWWSAWDMESADLNNDGRLDLVICFDVSNDGLMVTALGTGGGGFIHGKSISIQERDVEILDLSGSDSLDIVTARGTVFPVAADGEIGGSGLPNNQPFQGFLTQNVLDFNKDGVDDLLTFDFALSSLDLYLMDGEGVVATVMNIYNLGGPFYAFPYVGDLNGDGFLDIILVTGFDVTTFMNLNGTSVGPPITSTDPCFVVGMLFSIVVGDLNNDGFADLVRGNEKEKYGAVGIGNGAGGFSFNSITFPNVPGVLAMEDFNNDNNLDLGFPCGCYYVLPGLGNGAFGPAIQSDKTTVVKHQAAGDVDNDGDPDVVVNEPKGIRLLTNDGTGYFTQKMICPTSSVMDLVLADLDKDGDLDLSVNYGHFTDKIRFFENKNGHFFTVQPHLPMHAAGIVLNQLPTSFRGQLYAGDFDGDGLTDLTSGAVTSDTSALLPLIFFNRTMLWKEGIALQGRTLTFKLRAHQCGNRPYLLLASSTGSYPGTPLGPDRLPLNYDPILWPLCLGGAPFFVQFFGQLDNTGKAEAKLIVPKGAITQPLPLDFAFISSEAKAPHPMIASNRCPVTVR